MLITVELVSEQHGLDPVYGKVCLGIIITIGGPVQPYPLVVLVVFDGRAPMLVQGFSGVGPAGPVKVQVGGYTVAMREAMSELSVVIIGQGVHSQMQKFWYHKLAIMRCSGSVLERLCLIFLRGHVVSQADIVRADETARNFTVIAD